MSQKSHLWPITVDLSIGLPATDSKESFRGSCSTSNQALAIVPTRADASEVQACPSTVDGKDCDAWYDGVVAYAEYRIAELSRDTAFRRNRFHPLRTHYNELIFAAREYQRRQPIRLVQPECGYQAPAEPAPLPFELEYAKWSRADLVSHLMAEDSTLTSARLISHYTKAKLGHMLAVVRLRNVEAVRA